MKSLKIVIISKNCYPALGPRAHRATELAKELARKGHEVILCALLGNYDYTEYSKQTGITFKNLGKSKLGVTDNTGYYNKAIWAKGLRKLFKNWLEVPNIELISLVKKALKKEGNIDYLVTIAHPHTIHWGAASYVKKNREKIKLWVADCGDPYMKDPYNYRPTYFSYFEKSWGELCDYITVPIKEAKSAYYSSFQNKIKVTPQGFQFNDLKLANYTKNEVPTFAFSGKIYPGLRDPSKFLDYLLTLKLDFRFILYSKNALFYEPYKSKLNEKIEIRDYVPRKELLYELSKMDFLINIKNISGVQQPSKLIDYALTKRPVLEITSDFEEIDAFNQFLEGVYINKLDLKDISRYDIKNVVSQFLNLYK